MESILFSDNFGQSSCVILGDSCKLADYILALKAQPGANL